MHARKKWVRPVVIAALLLGCAAKQESVSAPDPQMEMLRRFEDADRYLCTRDTPQGPDWPIDFKHCMVLRITSHCTKFKNGVFKETVSDDQIRDTVQKMEINVLPSLIQRYGLEQGSQYYERMVGTFLTAMAVGTVQDWCEQW